MYKTVFFPKNSPHRKTRMNSLCFPTPLLLPPISSSMLHQSPKHFQFPQLHNNANHKKLSSSFPSHCTSSQSKTEPEGPVSVVNFQDLFEKDWSFLENDQLNTPTQQAEKANLIISEAQIGKSCRLLLSIPSEDFVDKLVESSSSLCEVVLVVHDSLFVLAGIKEKHDKVICWQGELVYVPDKWAPFDVVFLCYLPALPFELGQIFPVFAHRCSPGARLVISFPQGREVVEQQRKEFPDVVVSDLPHKLTLEKVASDHSFEVTKFIDEPGFYLAVLKFSGMGLSPEQIVNAS